MSIIPGMLIIPVLDLKAGQAVHAIRGKRQQYMPVQGSLGNGEDAVALAQAYQQNLGCRVCYVADLDAITIRRPQRTLIEALVESRLKLWVDAGVSTVIQAKALVAAGVTRVIIGTETLPSLAHLDKLTAAFPASQLVLSLDWRKGELQAPIDSAEWLIAHSTLTDFILLDLDRVGNQSGPMVETLVHLRQQFPQANFYAGGGIRNRADLEALDSAGAAGALVATALHRGDLTAQDLEPWLRA